MRNDTSANCEPPFRYKATHVKLQAEIFDCQASSVTVTHRQTFYQSDVKDPKLQEANILRLISTRRAPAPFSSRPCG